MSDWLGMIPAPRAPRPELRAQVLGRAARGGWGGRGGLRRRPSAGLAAAAVLVAVLLGGAYWVQGAIAGLRAELAAARDTLELVRGATTRAVTVPVSTGGRPGAVTIFADGSARRWLVRCEGMAPNAPEETYQIWFVTESGMRHAALMTMHADEPTVMTMAIAIPEDAGRVMGAAMSIEPRSGSAEPRGPMVFRVQL